MAFGNPRVTRVPGFYSVPIPGTQEKGYSAVYRNPDFEDIIGASNFNDARTAWDLFQIGLKKNPNAPCISKRELLSDGTLGQYKSKSYREVECLAITLGSAICQLDVIKEQESGHPKVKPCKLFGLYVPNCEEWLLCEHACNAYGYTLVPIYSTLGTRPVNSILVNSGLAVLLCNVSTARSLFSVLKFSTENVMLKLVILIGTTQIPAEFAENTYGIEFILWDAFLAMGERKRLPTRPSDPDALNVISYTSGTTGSPKGVMITQQNLVDLIVVTIEHVAKKSRYPKGFLDAHISYLPMAHLFEKTFINAVFYVGGHVGLYSGDVKKILEDVQLFKPTYFMSVPRLYQRIHDKVMSSVSEKSEFVKWLFRCGLVSKMRRARAHGNYQHFFWDTIFFKRIKGLLGGNIKWMFIGSSSMNITIADRIKVFFGTQLVWGYALTECAAGATIQDIRDTDSSHCGGPIATLQFRIRSVSELSYFAEGNPPRGELLIRGKNVTHGYFKMKNLTDETIVDGWFHTGDIVELLENGAIRIIDRLKHLFKLSQGEYVSPEYLESVINSSDLVAQSFVFGKPDEPVPMAVVVPDEDRLNFWKRSNGMAHFSFEEVCKSERLYNAIMEDLGRLFEENEVKGYERVKAIHIEPQMFTVENNLLTVTSKLKRHNLSEKYSSVACQMYEKYREQSVKTIRII